MLEQQREQQALKSMLSPSLKFEITKTVFSQVLVKNALFTDSTDILREYATILPIFQNE